MFRITYKNTEIFMKNRVYENHYPDSILLLSRGTEGGLGSGWSFSGLQPFSSSKALEAFSLFDEDSPFL